MLFASPEKWSLFLSQLGMITHVWAIIEISLDFAVAILFRGLEGAALQRKQPKHPEQKFEFLIECYNQLPALAAYKDKGLALIERAQTTATDRYFYAHAVAGNQYSGHGLWKIVHDPEIHGIEKRNLDLLEMQAFAASLTILAQDWASHVQDDLVPLVRRE